MRPGYTSRARLQFRGLVTFLVLFSVAGCVAPPASGAELYEACRRDTIPERCDVARAHLGASCATVVHDGEGLCTTSCEGAAGSCYGSPPWEGLCARVNLSGRSWDYCLAACRRSGVGAECPAGTHCVAVTRVGDGARVSGCLPGP